MKNPLVQGVSAPDPRRGLLGSDPEDRVCRLVEQDAHPDFLVLERQVEGGKTKKSISVEEARALPEFFSKSPSMARHRVAIVDAADDLNINSANALLKTLEEPPERSVLFLVSHSPARLLGTIRSRCRRLTFQPWGEAAVAEWLMTQTGLARADAEALAAMSGGSPGRALQLAEEGALEIDATARALVEGDAPDDAEMLRFADRLKGAEGQNRVGQPAAHDDIGTPIERLDHRRHAEIDVGRLDLGPDAGTGPTTDQEL